MMDNEHASLKQRGRYGYTSKRMVQAQNWMNSKWTEIQTLLSETHAKAVLMQGTSGVKKPQEQFVKEIFGNWSQVVQKENRFPKTRLRSSG